MGVQGFARPRIMSIVNVALYDRVAVDATKSYVIRGQYLYLKDYLVYTLPTETVHTSSSRLAVRYFWPWS